MRVINKEFERRLRRLQKEIEICLQYGNPFKGLFPAIFSVASFLYCRSTHDVTKRKE